MTKTNQTREDQRNRHIRHMREELEQLSGQPPSVFVAPNIDSELEEKFLEHVLAFEGADEVPLFDELVKRGISLPPAEDLDDAQLSARLWEVIQAMSLLGHYLYHTDHLSDRELYVRLWTDTLREPTAVLPANSNYACHIDLLGGWSEEDARVYLKYYADEEERLDWAGTWPEDAIPAHEELPYSRDRSLPQPSFESEDSPER